MSRLISRDNLLAFLAAEIAERRGHMKAEDPEWVRIGDRAYLDALSIVRTHVEWQPLIEAGYSELELRAASGDR